MSVEKPKPPITVEYEANFWGRTKTKQIETILVEQN